MRAHTSRVLVPVHQQWAPALGLHQEPLSGIPRDPHWGGLDWAPPPPAVVFSSSLSSVSLSPWRARFPLLQSPSPVLPTPCPISLSPGRLRKSTVHLAFLRGPFRPSQS